MSAWMLTDPRAPELPFRFEGTELLSWYEGNLQLDKLPWMLDYLCDLLDRVPAFVWKSG